MVFRRASRHYLPRVRGRTAANPDKSRALARGGSRPVSRVLSLSNHSSGIHVTVNLKRPTRKHARTALPRVGPEAYAKATFLFGLAPGGVCRADSVTRVAVRSYRTVSPLPAPLLALGGLLSVALSVGSRPPGVTWHLVRRSPDFPPPLRGKSSDCPADSQCTR